MPISSHMSPDEFRRHGREMIEFIARYMEDVENYPVLSQVKPGWVRGQLPEKPPESSESFDQMLADVERIILPGITHWQSPNFFAYFPANTSGPAILGELLSAGLGVQGMLWATSPACTELETLMLDWLVDMLDLPRKFRSDSQHGGGVIQDTASSATLCALLAARDKVWKTHPGATLTAYASTQAHSSVEKAMMISGLGRENLRLIAVDEAFAMRPDALRRAIESDVKNHRTPCFVCATVGTTSSNGIDPVRTLGDITNQHNIWLHVDAAMSGTAALCPEFRWIHDGLERADSYCFNPHKWMLTNFDCDCFYVANRDDLVNSLTVQPEYLRNQTSETGSVIDYRDWQIPLGRRFRALKLWFVIRHYGIEGLRAHVREHIRLAQMFTQWVNEDHRFELAVEPPLNLICFRHKDGDEPTQRIMDQLNASGKLYLTHTRLHDKLTLRFAIGGTYTREGHVRQAWELIRSAAS